MSTVQFVGGTGKQRVFDNEAAVSMERLPTSGYWLVELWDVSGSRIDRVRCDSKEVAEVFFRDLCDRAKGLK